MRYDVREHRTKDDVYTTWLTSTALLVSSFRFQNCSKSFGFSFHPFSLSSVCFVYYNFVLFVVGVCVCSYVIANSGVKMYETCKLLDLYSLGIWNYSSLLSCESLRNGDRYVTHVSDNPRTITPYTREQLNTTLTIDASTANRLARHSSGIVRFSVRFDCALLCGMCRTTIAFVRIVGVDEFICCHRYNWFRTQFSAANIFPQNLPKSIFFSCHWELSVVTNRNVAHRWWWWYYTSINRQLIVHMCQSMLLWMAIRFAEKPQIKFVFGFALWAAVDVTFQHNVAFTDI